MNDVTVMAKTRKVGGSLVVTIPKAVAELEGIAAEQIIEIYVRKPKKSYRGIFRGIELLKKEEKLDAHSS